MAQVQGSGASQVKQLYSYDANGDVVSVNYNGTEYYYLRNGQRNLNSTRTLTSWIAES